MTFVSTEVEISDLEKLKKRIKEFSKSKIYILHDEKEYLVQIIDQLLESKKDCEVKRRQVYVFTQENLDECIEISKDVRAFQPDLIISVGSGLLVNSVKLISGLAKLNTDILVQDILSLSFTDAFKIWCLLELPISGSEFSGRTIVSKGLEFTTVSSSKLIPEFASIYLDRNHLSKRVILSSYISVFASELEQSIESCEYFLSNQKSTDELGAILKDILESVRNFLCYNVGEDQFEKEYLKLFEIYVKLSGIIPHKEFNKKTIISFSYLIAQFYKMDLADILPMMTISYLYECLVDKQLLFCTKLTLCMFDKDNSMDVKHVIYNKSDSCEPNIVEKNIYADDGEIHYYLSMKLEDYFLSFGYCLTINSLLKQRAQSYSFEFKNILNGFSIKPSILDRVVVTNTEERYDRQLKLWQEIGQQHMAESIVISLGSDVLSGEVLKNIALHGFGTIIIVDDQVVNEDDVNENFLTPYIYLGHSRCEAVNNNLRELNDDPVYISIHRDPFAFTLDYLPDHIVKKIDGLNSVFILTTGNLTTEFISRISDLSRKHGIKYVHCQSSGFFSELYMDCQRHFVYSSGKSKHNDNCLMRKDTDDIYRDILESMKKIDHGQVSRSKTIDDSIIRDKQTLNEFFNTQRAINSAIPKAIESYLLKSDIIDNQLKILDKQQYKLPDNLENVFSILEKNPDLTSSGEKFWRLVDSLKEFYEIYGSLPAPRSIDDEDNVEQKSFIILQNKIRDVHNSDVQVIMDIYRRKYPGTIENLPYYVEKFCEYCHTCSCKDFIPVKDLINNSNFENIQFTSSFAIIPEKKAEYMKSIILRSLSLTKRKLRDKGIEEAFQNDEIEKIAEDTLKETLEKVKSIPDDIRKEILESYKGYIDLFFVTEGFGLPAVLTSIGSVAAAEITKSAVHQQVPMGKYCGIVFSSLDGSVIPIA